MINNNIYCSLLQPLKHFCQKVSVAPCSHSLLEPRSRTVPWHCSSVCSYHLCDSRVTQALVMLSHLLSAAASWWHWEQPTSLLAPVLSPADSTALRCLQNSFGVLLFFFFSFILSHFYRASKAPQTYSLTHFTLWWETFSQLCLVIE